MRWLLILCLFFPIALTQLQKFYTPTICAENTTLYFNTLLFRCEACPESEIAAAGTLACKCGPDSIRSNGTCTICPNSQIPNADQQFCSVCEGENCGCDSGSIRAFHDSNGRPLSKVACFKCPPETHPDENGINCIPCEIPGCQSASPANLTRINPNIDEIRSVYIETLLPTAIQGCQAQNTEACQMLINLCTLQKNAISADNACSYYSDLASGVMRNKLPPTLSQTFPTVNALGGPPAKYKLEESPQGRLVIYVATFFTNGTMQSFLPLETSQLAPPRLTTQTLHEALAFGVAYSLDSKIDLNFAEQHDGLFYEFLLQVPPDMSLNFTFEERRMCPIYVASSMMNPNLDSELTQQKMEQLQLTRRFFMYDSKSVKSDNFTIARFVKQLTFEIYLESSRDGRIGVPLVKIIYDQIIPGDVEFFEVPFKLGIHYSQDPFRHDKDMEITMATISVLSVLWGATQAYSWGRRNGRQLFDIWTFMQLIFMQCGILGNVFLFVITVMACWLTFLYKNQSNFYYRLPMASQETSMMRFAWAALGLKFVAFIHNRWCISNGNTFFIDWEKPRNLTNLPVPRGQPSAQAPPIIWRTYLVANEWNELQSYRKTSVALQVVLIPLILEYFGWINWAVVRPGFSLQPPPEGFVISTTTSWAVVMFVYLALVFLQWAISVLIYERVFKDRFHDFVDLCSVCNISVLSMAHTLQGYYIHGRSPHGRSDTDMREINEYLQRERDGVVGQRGLEINTELQTFYYSFPRLFNDRIEKIKAEVYPPSPPIPAGVNPSTAKVAAITRLHDMLNSYFISVFDRTTNEFTFILRDLTFLEALLDMDLDDSVNCGKMVRDRSETGFTACFAYGHEWVAVSFEAILYLICYQYFQSLILASAIVFGFYTITHNLFAIIFTHKLVKSSCVDQRFLI